MPCVLRPGVALLRKLRIAVLLYVLAFVAVGTLVESNEATNWDFPLHVVVYPIAADGTPAVKEHIDTLDSRDFTALASFLADEASRHSVALDRPFAFSLAPERGMSLPAIAPRPSRVQILLWSLRMRWLSLKLNWRSNLPKPDITVFAVYHDPDSNLVLDSSTALRKGLIAVANLYADSGYRGSNQLVIAHELLHTLGATDKYDYGSLQPLYPLGYAEPERNPLHPQRFAEIMAGRRALSADTAEMPSRLRDVQIGPVTAIEIGWPDGK